MLTAEHGGFSGGLDRQLSCSRTLLPATDDTQSTHRMPLVTSVGKRHLMSP